MVGYEHLYFSDLAAGSLNDVFGSGLCVKYCPNGTEMKDAAWWTANCKDNSKIKCADMAAATAK